MRRVLPLLVAVAACGGGDEGVSVSGNAFIFTGGFIEDGVVSVLEVPGVTAVTDADGFFRLDGLPADGEITLVLSAPDYVPIQTGTLPVTGTELERVTFQAVHEAIFALLADMLEVTPDPAMCQIATTVTRVGKSLYDEGAHGEAGATVTIDPPLTGDAEGPIYFNASVVPDRTLTETSEDGGVVFVNVPPGRYVLTATKTGVTFTAMTITCRAGMLVNASPPWGLQAQ
jgi:hypothetical protein